MITKILQLDGIKSFKAFADGVLCYGNAISYYDAALRKQWTIDENVYELKIFNDFILYHNVNGTDITILNAVGKKIKMLEGKFFLAAATQVRDGLVVTKSNDGIKEKYLIKKDFELEKLPPTMPRIDHFHGDYLFSVEPNAVKAFINYELVWEAIVSDFGSFHDKGIRREGVISGPIIVEKKLVIVPIYPHKLAAFSLGTGDMKWIQQLQMPSLTPKLHEGKLYVMNRLKYFYVIDLVSGRIELESDVMKKWSGSGFEGSFTNHLVTGEAIYMSDMFQGTVVKMNKRNASIESMVKITDMNIPEGNSPEIINERLFVLDVSNSLHICAL